VKPTFRFLSALEERFGDAALIKTHSGWHARLH
jgi:hypothetical protein